MKVKELKIEDVLKMELYEKTLKSIVDELQNIRKKAREKAFRNGDTIIAHPIDRLIEWDVWNVHSLIAEYKDALNKCSARPKAVRDFILDVCTEAFNKTMAKLIEDEEKNDKCNGKD